MARLPVLFLLLTAPAALPAQAADSGAFVITLGTDTIAVERYTRSRDELRDDMVLRDRSPVTTRRLVAMLPMGSRRHGDRRYRATSNGSRHSGRQSTWCRPV